jgi:hypothetical protein
MGKIEVIGYIGVIGSGKSYNTELRLKEGYLNINFADKVREICWGVLGWEPQNNLEYELFKKSVITKKLNYFDNKDNLTLLGEADFITGRELLIRIGDGFRNKFYEDIWIDSWIKSVKKSNSNKIVVSDCRYLNEVFKILQEPSFDSRFIFCNYKSGRYQILDNESEWMSQKLLDFYKDQEEIDIRDFYELLKVKGRN